MASLVTQFVDDYIFHWYRRYQYSLQFADPRSSKWLLMQSPLPTFILVVIYLSIVRFGPIYMKNRKPYQLQLPLLIYNIAMMVLNFYIATELVYCAFYQLNYNWFCQLVNTSDNPYEMRVAHCIWWYYFSKLVEFMDTFFFILRKKDKQLSFLHVYHHSTMFALWWIGAKYVPGGSAAPGAIVNCYVHVLMYLYYGLSAMGPKIQKFLWWKKYITIIQLIQFMTALVCGTWTLLSGCRFTLWMQYAFVTYAVILLLLFGNFYLYAYIKNVTALKGRKARNAKALANKAQKTNKTIAMNGSLAKSEAAQKPTNGLKNGHVIDSVRLRNHILVDGSFSSG